MIDRDGRQLGEDLLKLGEKIISHVNLRVPANQIIDAPREWHEVLELTSIASYEVEADATDPLGSQITQFGVRHRWLKLYDSDEPRSEAIDGAYDRLGIQPLYRCCDYGATLNAQTCDRREVVLDGEW